MIDFFVIDSESNSRGINNYCGQYVVELTIPPALEPFVTYDPAIGNVITVAAPQMVLQSALVVSISLSDFPNNAVVTDIPINVFDPCSSA